MEADSGLSGYLTECRARVESALERRLPPAGTQPRRLHQAMRYAVLGNGKRIRPSLIYAAGKAVDDAGDGRLAERDLLRHRGAVALPSTSRRSEFW